MFRRHECTLHSCHPLLTTRFTLESLTNFGMLWQDLHYGRIATVQVIENEAEECVMVLAGGVWDDQSVEVLCHSRRQQRRAAGLSLGAAHISSTPLPNTKSSSARDGFAKFAHKSIIRITPWSSQLATVSDCVCEFAPCHRSSNYSGTVPLDMDDQEGGATRSCVHGGGHLQGGQRYWVPCLAAWVGY